MIRVITDSASDIKQAEAKELGIKVIPLTVTIQGKEYKDGVDLSIDEFYEKLVSSKELPKTSQVTVYQFMEAFDEINDEDDCIVITISSKLSGTYSSANIAKENRKNIHLVDSYNVSLGENIIVRRVLELIKKGKNVSEILSIIEEEKKYIKVIGLVDTLEYLKKGGRISAATAFIGNTLCFKPVIELADGVVKLVGKARGSKNGHNKLREIIKNNPIDFSRPIMLAYSGTDKSSLLEYVNDSKDLYIDNELQILQIGSTIGTHIGPNVIAVAYFKI